MKFNDIQRTSQQNSKKFKELFKERLNEIQTN